MIFDTHSHYDDRAFDEDRESLLGSLEENGIGNIVCVGADMKSSKAAMELAHSYEFAYAAVGVHPMTKKSLPSGKSVLIITGKSRSRKFRKNGSTARLNWQKK